MFVSDSQRNAVWQETSDIERGLAGLEFGCGIPGTAGGWVAMNAGIPGREVKDVVREIEVISPTGREVRHIPRAELRFTYRALRGLAPGSVILSAPSPFA